MQQLHKIIIVDDHPLFRQALCQSIKETFSNINIIEANCFENMQSVVSENLDTDIILLDLSMPGVKGFSGLLFLRGQHPEIPVVVVSGNERSDIIAKSISFGASGFIPKSSPLEVIVEALNTITLGNIWIPENFDNISSVDSEKNVIAQKIGTLTEKQFKVFTLITEGLLNKQIADIMNVSEATVKAHITAIFNKLDLSNRSQVIIAARELDINSNEDM